MNIREVWPLFPAPTSPSQSPPTQGSLTSTIHHTTLTSSPLPPGIIQSLQHLHEELRHYHAPPVVHPTLESAKPNNSLFSWFGGGKTPIREIPGNLPRGLYLFGDVGCGKTMLMDLFLSLIHI